VASLYFPQPTNQKLRVEQNALEVCNKLTNQSGSLKKCVRPHFWVILYAVREDSADLRTCLWSRWIVIRFNVSSLPPSLSLRWSFSTYYDSISDSESHCQSKTIQPGHQCDWIVLNTRVTGLVYLVKAKDTSVTYSIPRPTTLDYRPTASRPSTTIIASTLEM